jgi:hypothetical protein
MPIYLNFNDLRFRYAKKEKRIGNFRKVQQEAAEAADLAITDIRRGIVPPPTAATEFIAAAAAAAR